MYPFKPLNVYTEGEIRQDFGREHQPDEERPREHPRCPHCGWSKPGQTFMRMLGQVSCLRCGVTIWAGDFPEVDLEGLVAGDKR